MNPDITRLPATSYVDLSKPIRFTFNGTGYIGYDGDTLASALIRNGVRVIGRSFKYHRPRGIMSAGIEETNAIVQVLAPFHQPNTVATTLRLCEGLETESVNCWPSVNWDISAINEWLQRFMPAGFYYKTFMWPANGWNFYGRIIRRMAGLGKAPRQDSENTGYEKRFHHCDILVIGAGPAGLAAAYTAATSNARVTLVDQQPEAGGSLPGQQRSLNGAPAKEWVESIVVKLHEFPNVQIFQNTTAFGYYDHNMIYAVQSKPEQHWLRERLFRIRAGQVIIATGAIERPLVFPNNDRPSVMLASAAATYVNRYGVKPGYRAVFVTNNNSAYESAFSLVKSGTQVTVVDTRLKINEQILNAVRENGISLLSGHTVTTVKGKWAVTGIVVAPISNVLKSRLLPCDLICTSGGWNPTVHLHSQSGTKPVYDEAIASFVPGSSVQAETSVGSACGAFDLEACLTGGAKTGLNAAQKAGFQCMSIDLPSTDTTDFPLEIEAVWQLPKNKKHARAFVDFQEDVTSGDVALALRENFESVELVKRYTTVGMGIDQGKTSNVNTIGIISELKGVTPDKVGTTTYRPAYSPASFGAWGGFEQGELIFPARRTPITPWIERNGGKFDEAGALWRRPFQFLKAGESPEDAVNREALAVRNSAGIYDGTPLGKIELRGPDSITLLNRLYTNNWDNIRIGMGRFGFMLFEDGRLFDDGVTFRLGEKHFLMSTGSGVAHQVYTHIQRLLQCDWRDLRVYLTEVTEQWANMCVCGPQARQVLEAAGTDIDLSCDKFPFMGIRSGQIAGYPVRVARVSYTGELSFEVNVRARDGLSMWQALMNAGEPVNITPVGSETSLLLRLEKGFVAAWAEGDGNVLLPDAGMNWVIAKSKDDFIGKRTMENNLAQGGLRPQIVGLIPTNPSAIPPDGAPIIDSSATTEAQVVIGNVTAGGYSPNLGHSIALAQLNDGAKHLGHTVTVSTVDCDIPATVTKPVFIDPTGERMRG